MVGLPAWAVVRPKRLAHIERVVETLRVWAVAMTVPPAERDQWLRAAWLHDALRDAPIDELRRLAPRAEGPVELWHGPAAAARAREDGERDESLLLAITNHSLGDASWDRCGWMLYCADYLEPGRKFDVGPRSLLREQLPADPAAVLREVVRARVLHSIRSGWPMHPLTMGLWNRVADAVMTE